MDAFGPHNSQHLFDPYSLIHFIKGILYCGAICWAFPKLPWTWGLVLAAGLEGAWEVFENSPAVIERYRTATIAVGYQGDTLINSLGDVVSSAVGFMVARRLGLRWSIGVVITLEILLLLWIRDSLLLTLVMLIHSFESIKTWQSGHSP